MSKKRYLEAEKLKQRLFGELVLGNIKTVQDLNNCIDTQPEADPQEMARQLWRDAKKDPPDPNVDVIVYCSDGAILTAFMYENGDWAENRECIPLDDVTHWMPNITGPELEEKNNG